MKNVPRLITVTPKEAARILELNTNNRKIKPQRVRLYADEMEAGNWRINGECLKISENDVVLDGQHRLLACVLSKKEFQTFIMTDLPEDIMPTIDQGVARTPGDIMHLFGISNSNAVSSALKKYILLKSGFMAANLKISATALLNEYNKRPEYWQHIANISQVVYVKINKVILQSTLAAYLSWLSEHGDAESFFKTLELSGKTPGSMLVKYMTRAKLTRKRVPNTEFYGLIIKCFEAFKKNKDILLLQYKEGESIPEIYKK